MNEQNTYEELVGGKYFFRTVTYHSVGKVIGLMGKFVRLEGASWIADSGRFSETIKRGTISEYEHVGQMLVNMESVVDLFPWEHPLPDGKK